MLEPAICINGVTGPRFFYGTAWKEDQTERLTALALTAGFRAIDTANQRRHYSEEGVGRAVAGAIRAGVVTREELFIQTKYTFVEGQDHRLPYEPSGPTERQVEQSLASSLEHLQTDRIDSYLLHGPTTTVGLGERDWQAWRAMEQAHQRGVVRFIGVSNVSAEQLHLLCHNSVTRPTFVQNRCFAITGWDADVRKVCEAEGIVYQGVSLLTANHPYLMHPAVTQIAQRHGRSIPQVIFRFAMHLGMVPLTGTSNPAHMVEDLESLQFDLEASEVELLEQIALD